LVLNESSKKKDAGPGNQSENIWHRI